MRIADSVAVNPLQKTCDYSTQLCKSMSNYALLLTMGAVLLNHWSVIDRHILNMRTQRYADRVHMTGLICDML